MRSTRIKDWFDCNEGLFEGLDRCRKYFELIDGEISEFKYVFDDLTLRYDFTVTSSLSYAKTKKITMTFNRANGTLDTYYQKEE